MRVSVTRLRAVVTFFAPMTVDPIWLGLKKDLAQLHALLGAARDGHVMASYARRKHYRAWANREGVADPVQNPRRNHRSLGNHLRSGRFRGLIKGLSAWIRSGPWLARHDLSERQSGTESLNSYSEEKLKYWRGRLLHKGRRLSTLGGSRRHRLRIKVKRYRYILEALIDLDPKYRGQWRREQKLVSQLQRSLGDLRDLENFRHAGAETRSKTGSRRRGSSPPGYRHRQKKLLAKAVATFRAFKQAAAR